MKSVGVYLFIIVLGILSQLSLVRADVWDLGYSNPDPIVEKIEEEIEYVEEEVQQPEPSEVQDEVAAAPVKTVQKPKKASPKSTSNVSTVQNTFGVETIERSEVQFYLAPVFGFSSLMGNETVAITAQYAYGARGGVLLSDYLMIEAGYSHAFLNLSNPVMAGSVAGQTNVYGLTQNMIDVVGKFFFLGRESRLRPFVGGGLAYTSSSMNYTELAFRNMGSPMAFGAEFNIDQFLGSGTLGAEYAFSRTFVATLGLRINAVASMNNSLGSPNTAFTFDSNKSSAGASISRSASYGAMAGIGVYF